MGMLNYAASNGVQALRQSYFTSKNGTFGTGIACNGTPTAITATEIMMTMYNGESSALVIPDYIQLRCTAIGTANVDTKLLFMLDNKNRWSSGGTKLTNASTYMIGGQTTNATSDVTCYFGDVTGNAASANVVETAGITLASAASATAVEVGDVYHISFGTDTSPGSLMLHDSQENLHNYVVPPHWVGPGATLCVYLWQTSASAASSFEVDCGWIQREPGAAGIE